MEAISIYQTICHLL